MAALTIQSLQKIRKVEQFDLFWEKVKNRLQELKVNEPQLLRRKRLPKRFDEGSESYHPTPVEEIHIYRKHYFKALDLAVNCIKDRMDQSGYVFYANLENLLTKTVIGQIYENELNFAFIFYTSDINRRDIKTQLETMKADPKVRSEETAVKIIVDYLVEGICVCSI